MATPCPATEPQILQRVTVRLLREDERPAFDRLLETQHYLASAQLAGQTLRYVAELDGQWVALLTFSAAAFHLKLRERWIRWSPRPRPTLFPAGEVSLGEVSLVGHSRLFHLR